MNIYADITTPFWSFINDVNSGHFSDIKSIPSYTTISEVIQSVNGLDVIIYIREHPNITGLHPNLIPHYTIKTIIKPNDSHVYVFEDINDAFYGMKDMMETTRNNDIADRISFAIKAIESYNHVDMLSDTLDRIVLGSNTK